MSLFQKGTEGGSREVQVGQPVPTKVMEQIILETTSKQEGQEGKW